MFRVIICELTHPSLWKLAGLILRDAGIPEPTTGCLGVPGEFALQLRRLERAASSLSTTTPAPEDHDASQAAAEGEAPRYLDSEMAAFALGDESLARSIASRIPDGSLLLGFVEKVTGQYDHPRNLVI